MAGKGAPIGNTHAAKSNRLVTDTLRLAVTQNKHKLRAGLEAILDEAEKGDLTCMTFIADRLDGKPKQSVELGEDPEAPLFSMLADASKLRTKIRGE